MPGPPPDPRVDDYVAGLPPWQQRICQRVRELVHEADPDIEETVKRRVRPYFVLEGNVCALLATKRHVDVFLYDGSLPADPEGIITGGHDNTTARTVAIAEGEEIPERALVAMLREIAATNRAGGWRRAEVARADCDAQAAGFDHEADHGLADLEVRAAWLSVLQAALPDPPATILDLGCGTGSLAVLLAQEGHRLEGLDLSPVMIARARAKAAEAGVEVRLAVGNAGWPRPAAEPCDVVLVRHVLWALPDPARALDRWVDLLAPGGRLVLVEGEWHTGAGLALERTRSLVEGAGLRCEVRPLEDPTLWGGPVTDSRYLVVGMPSV